MWMRVVLAASVALASSACHRTGGSSDNMLIGEWKRTNTGCGDEREIYTDSQFQGFESPGSPQPGWRKVDVTYNVSPEEIYIIPNQGGAPLATKVIPIDRDHFKEDNLCAGTYERVS